ncbi:hypothetical protein DFH07DRAFT_774705 [Mycena maculata]|uniref:Uncharacterized protein n=1 Tax=Mycena maculata TaxID=230809 RepID=A0AAD7N8Y7_9AGAR|nr:hypothetical protein DFH07DRAFT_774705 [Mycena maculata]
MSDSGLVRIMICKGQGQRKVGDWKNEEGRVLGDNEGTIRPGQDRKCSRGMWEDTGVEYIRTQYTAEPSTTRYTSIVDVIVTRNIPSAEESGKMCSVGGRYLVYIAPGSVDGSIEWYATIYGGGVVLSAMPSTRRRQRRMKDTQTVRRSSAAMFPMRVHVDGEVISEALAGKAMWGSLGAMTGELRDGQGGWTTFQGIHSEIAGPSDEDVRRIPPIHHHVAYLVAGCT